MIDNEEQDALQQKPVTQLIRERGERFHRRGRKPKSPESQRLSKNALRLLRHLLKLTPKENPIWSESVEEVAKGLGIDPSTVKRLRRRFCEVGVLVPQERQGGRGKPAQYQVDLERAETLLREGVWGAAKKGGEKEAQKPGQEPKPAQEIPAPKPPSPPGIATSDTSKPPSSGVPAQPDNAALLPREGADQSLTWRNGAAVTGGKNSGLPEANLSNPDGERERLDQPFPEYFEKTTLATEGRSNKEVKKMVTEASFPVKVPGPLYAKLKEEAEREGITIQEALVRIIAEPKAALEKIRSWIAQVEQRQTEMERKLTNLEERLEKATDRLTSLEGRISHHAHPNYALKGELAPLSETLKAHEQKISALTAGMASLKDKTAQIEQAITQLQNHARQLAEDHRNLAGTLNSWTPYWNKIPTLETNVSALKTQLDRLEGDFNNRDSRLREIFEDFNVRILKLEKSVKALQKVSHEHIGQSLWR